MHERFFVAKRRQDGRLGPVCGPYDHKTDAERDMDLGNERACAVDPYMWFDATVLVGTTDAMKIQSMSAQVDRLKTWLAQQAREES